MRLAAEARVGYDSNVFNRDDDTNSGDIESGMILLRVSGEAEDELERGSYKVRYSPTYIINTASEADNTWNHNASVEGRYNFSPQTSIVVSDSFAFLEKIDFEEDDSPLDPNLDESGNRETTRNTAVVTLQHLFTQRWSGYTTGNYSIYRFNRERDADNDVVSGSIGTNYAFNKQLRLGFGGSSAYRTFEGDPAPIATGLTPGPNPMPVAVPLCFGQDAQRGRTLSYSAFASGSYQFNETTSVNLQAGPARIESSSYQCPGLNQQWDRRTSAQTTWFASGEFLKRWQFVKTSLRYRRQEGTSGAGSTSVNDSLIARLDWKISELWDMGVRGAWVQRNSEFGAGQGDSDTTSWIASVKIRRKILRRLHVFADASYRNQDEDNNRTNQANGPSSRNFDTWRAFLGVRYQFDPLTY